MGARGLKVGSSCEASRGSAARFFYTAKSSRSERKRGLRGHVPCVKCGGLDTETHRDEQGRAVRCRRNDHPTVKPLALMAYLARLTRTPFGGIVLDPFCGSGTTGVACVQTGRAFVGIELEERYCEIAARRIEAAVVAGKQLELAGATG